MNGVFHTPQQELYRTFLYTTRSSRGSIALTTAHMQIWNKPPGVNFVYILAVGGGGGGGGAAPWSGSLPPPVVYTTGGGGGGNSGATANLLIPASLLPDQLFIYVGGGGKGGAPGRNILPGESQPTTALTGSVGEYGTASFVAYTPNTIPTVQLQTSFGFATCLLFANGGEPGQAGSSTSISAGGSVIRPASPETVASVGDSGDFYFAPASASRHAQYGVRKHQPSSVGSEGSPQASTGGSGRVLVLPVPSLVSNLFRSSFSRITGGGGGSGTVIGGLSSFGGSGSIVTPAGPYFTALPSSLGQNGQPGVNDLKNFIFSAGSGGSASTQSFAGAPGISGLGCGGSGGSVGILGSTSGSDGGDGFVLIVCI